MQASASFPRLLGYNKREWRSAVGGMVASACLGAVAPIFALAMATIVSVFYTTNFSYMKSTIACEQQPSLQCVLPGQLTDAD